MSRPRRVGAVVRHGRDAAGLDASAHRRCDLGQSHDFHYLWLRDNCRCPECRDPDAWERLFDTVAMPQDLTPRRIDGADGLLIEWPDGHHTQLSADWLWK